MNTFNIESRERKQAFNVPDDYFQHIENRWAKPSTAQINAKDSIKHSVTHHTLRRIAWTTGIAASIALLVALITPLLSSQNSTEPTSGSIAQIDYEDTEKYEQELLDYSLVDNTEIYAYLAGDM